MKELVEYLSGVTRGNKKSAMWINFEDGVPYPQYFEIKKTNVAEVLKAFNDTPKPRFSIVDVIYTIIEEKHRCKGVWENLKAIQECYDDDEAFWQIKQLGGDIKLLGKVNMYKDGFVSEEMFAFVENMKEGAIRHGRTVGEEI